MKTQFELNKELLEAAKKLDLEKVEDLLKRGADPMGCSDEGEANEHILGELFRLAVYDSALAETMPKLVRLFYAYGMNIAQRCIPDAEDNINPLWDLAFCQDENGLKTLKALLDNGLDCYGAEALVDHILLDMEICDGCHIDDVWFLERTVYALKMVMLTASFSHIIDGSDYIKECIALDENDANALAAFRDWDNAVYLIDVSTCTNTPHGLQNATVNIKDRKTDKIIWTFRI